jgi:hypothetical protein
MNEYEEEREIQKTLNKLDKYHKLPADKNKDDSEDSEFDMEDF